MASISLGSFQGKFTGKSFTRLASSTLIEGEEVHLFGRRVGREGAPGHAGVVHGEVARGDWRRRSQVGHLVTEITRRGIPYLQHQPSNKDEQTEGIENLKN